MMNITLDRSGVLLKANIKDKVKVDKGGLQLEAEILEIKYNVAKVRFEDGIEECIYLGSRRFSAVTSALSNPPLMEKLDIYREQAGTIVKAKVPRFTSRSFIPHDCSSKCMVRFIPKLFRNQNPLLIPLRFGWSREAVKAAGPELASQVWHICYVAPCAKRLRDMEEISHYLSICESEMEIDMFTFDPWVNVRDEFVSIPGKLMDPDLTQGKELNPIPAVNAVDQSNPPNVVYSCEAQPQGDVEIRKDPDFLVGCSCQDNCRDRNTCTCVQLTVKATAVDLEEHLVLHDAGYEHRRLKDVIITGIFECNSKCPCSRTCHNRVHQQPIRVKLQVFKTLRRGWGIRALHDIPQGTFICKYTGNVLNIDDANREGLEHGDNYFCELDLIEIVEKQKDGYESDVTDIEEENESVASDADRQTNQEDRKSDENCNGDSKQQMDVDQNSALEEVENKRKLEAEEFNIPPRKKKSVRKYYPEGEDDVYLVDALKSGNIGRYLNHSCDPNVCVQNVFQATHDLRFPTISFFTCKFVKAGDELCWNYNYEVGSVPGKQIDCHCGSETCKGRLL